MTNLENILLAICVMFVKGKHRRPCQIIYDVTDLLAAVPIGEK